jgi:hypothetical protein
VIFNESEQSATGGMSQGRHWSFSDVMQKMYDEDRTGVLAVSGPNMNWDIHIRKGHVVCVDVVGGDSWLLGDVLEASGMLSPGQLVRAERIAMKTGSTLGEVLVVKGLITLEALSRAYELQVRESLLPLFRRVGITCRFKKESPTPQPGAKPLPISFLIGEARRRDKLWPLLEERIPSLDTVYQCVEGTARNVFLSSSGQTGGSETSTIIASADIVDGDGPVSGSEKIVYYHLNGRKPVGTLALSTALGEFETTLAISRMLGRGVVVQTLNPDSMRKAPGKTIFPLLYQILFYGILAVFVAFVGLRFMEGGFLGASGDKNPRIEQFHSESIKQRVHRSLAVYVLEKGVYPTALDSLVDAELMTEHELEEHGSSFKYRASEAQDQYDLEVALKSMNTKDD